MGFIVADGAADIPWVRAIMDRHESLKGRPDNGIGHWSPDEWRDLEHLHQQHHQQQQEQQQQQQQEQQLRLQQYQQRQNSFRYRQQQQEQQYHLQQQYQTSRRWQHQQHFKRATAKKTSEERGAARANRGDAQAEKGGAPPTSQTTSKPPSLCEYPVVSSALQPVCREPSSINDELLDSMENGSLGKRAEIVQEEMVENSFQELEKPQQSLQAAQPRPCLPEEEAGKGDMGVLGKDLVLAGGLAVSAGGAGVEEERPPPSWDDDKFPVSWLAPDQAELEVAIFCAQRRLPAASREDTFVDDGKVVLGEDGEHAPPLLQQQQELQAAPPQEPWPPPMAAEEEERGAGSCVESGLWRLEFSSGCGSDDILSGGNGFCKESSSGKGGASYMTDGYAWERAGIGTGRSCSRIYMGAGSRAFWGCEVAGRRLTRRRRERVREK